MTLAALIQKGGLRRFANANPANAANVEGRRAGSLAGLAALALASPPSPKVECVPNDAESSNVGSTWTLPELLADWDERAAIKEYDGGMSRADAEREAWRLVMGTVH